MFVSAKNKYPLAALSSAVACIEVITRLLVHYLSTGHHVLIVFPLLLYINTNCHEYRKSDPY